MDRRDSRLLQLLDEFITAESSARAEVDNVEMARTAPVAWQRRDLECLDIAERRIVGVAISEARDVRQRSDWTPALLTGKQ